MGFKQRLALKARQNRGHDFSAELEELMRLVLNANGRSYAPSALNAFCYPIPRARGLNLG